MKFTSDQFHSINASNSPTMDGYVLVKFSAFFSTLESLYRHYAEIKEIKAIELLSPEEKAKYWNIAKRYYQDQPTAIKASKSAYMLTLLTSQ